MKKIKNYLLICSISFIAILLSLLLLTDIENKYNKWESSIINTSISDIEIMNTNYYNMKHLYPKNYFLYDYQSYLKVVKNVVEEENITHTLKYNGYIVSAKYEYKVLINGIEPEKYKLLFSNITNIIEGKYINSTDKYSSIICKTLAEKLNLKVGDRFIIRLLDVNNLYKVEELKVSGIVDIKNQAINKESIFINIGLLNDIIADKYAFSSMLIKTKNKNVYKSLRELFLDDIGIYTKYDILPLFTSNENKLKSIKKYIYLFFSITIFAIYFYINAKAFDVNNINNFKSSVIKNILFSLLGFLLATFILIIIFREKYNINFTMLLIVNILLLILSSSLPYIYTTYKNKRALKS